MDLTPAKTGDNAPIHLPHACVVPALDRGGPSPPTTITHGNIDCALPRERVRPPHLTYDTDMPLCCTWLDFQSPCPPPLPHMGIVTPASMPPGAQAGLHPDGCHGPPRNNTACRDSPTAPSQGCG